MQLSNEQIYQETRKLTPEQCVETLLTLIAMSSPKNVDMGTYIHSISSSSNYIPGKTVYQFSRQQRETELLKLTESGTLTVRYREGQREERLVIEIEDLWDISKMKTKDIVSFGEPTK